MIKTDILTQIKQADAELEKLYPHAECSLQYGGEPWKLLVMSRLSAQCTDVRVNVVSEELFKRFTDLRSLANADLNEIEEIVKPCGLYKVKARNIKDSCTMLLNEYAGEIPKSLGELLRFPGIGRKIANLLLGDLYNLGGIVVDTHCIRVCGRLGIYSESLKDPLKIEKILTPLIAESRQTDFCHRIVQFGRDRCTARAPKCGDCPLNHVCKGRRITAE